MEDRLTTRSACPKADQQLARPTWWIAHSEVWVGYDPTVAVRVESSRRHWTSTRGSHGSHRTGPTPVCPLEYCGRWIAWNHDRTRIVASGTTLTDARTAARQAGETRPFLTKAPEAHVRFVGGLR